MAHWAEAYVGRPWTEEHDCGWLVQTVLAERFGMTVRLPGNLDWRKAQPEDVLAIADAFVVETITPEEPDGVLMRIRGNRRSLGSHIGIFTRVSGAPWVLHSVEKMGVRFQPIDRLAMIQLEPLGYYRWR